MTDRMLNIEQLAHMFDETPGKIQRAIVAAGLAGVTAGCWKKLFHPDEVAAALERLVQDGS